MIPRKKFLGIFIVLFVALVALGVFWSQRRTVQNRAMRAEILSQEELSRIENLKDEIVSLEESFGKDPLTQTRLIDDQDTIDAPNAAEIEARLQALRIPQIDEIRAEYEKNPHRTAESLLVYATQLEQVYKRARENAESLEVFHRYVKNCSSDSTLPMAIQNFCSKIEY